jgi:hypothetical protein
MEKSIINTCFGCIELLVFTYEYEYPQLDLFYGLDGHWIGGLF